MIKFKIKYPTTQYDASNLLNITTVLKAKI